MDPTFDRAYDEAREVVRRYERELEEFIREDLSEAVQNGAINPVLREQITAVLHSEEYNAKIRTAAQYEVRRLIRMASIGAMVLLALLVVGVVVSWSFGPPMAERGSTSTDSVSVGGHQLEGPHGGVMDSPDLIPNPNAQEPVAHGEP